MDFLDFTSYDVDTWVTFFKEKWFVLVIALIVLMVVIKIVKTVLKWAIVAAIIIGIIIYSGYTLDDVKEFGSKVVDNGYEELKLLGSKVADSVKQEAVSAMVNGAKDAEYKLNDDGTYTVKTSILELTGELGANEVQLSLRGAPIGKVELDTTIQTFIDQAKQNG